MELIFFPATCFYGTFRVIRVIRGKILKNVGNTEAGVQNVATRGEVHETARAYGSGQFRKNLEFILLGDS